MKTTYQLGELVESRNINITDPTSPRTNVGIINAVVLRETGASYITTTSNGQEIAEDTIVQAYRPIPTKATRNRKPRQARVSNVRTPAATTEETAAAVAS